MKIEISSSSSEKIDVCYKDVSRNVANFLANNGSDLVWGSGSCSIMGICYEEFSKYDRKMFGFTSEKYADDINNLPYATHTVCKDTFLLKKEMFDNADILLMLPGGTGTISEFFTYLEEIRSNDAKKLLILYNAYHHFDSTLALIDDLIARNFNNENIYDYFKVANNLNELKEIILGIY